MGESKNRGKTPTGSRRKEITQVYNSVLRKLEVLLKMHMKELKMGLLQVKIFHIFYVKNQENFNDCEYKLKVVLSELH